MQPAGICLACSLECHDGHDLFELYTKRNFRCDCGNSRFSNLSCKLFPNKETENVQNMYNHNFRGLYCTCERPYPDPEDDVEDEMIQCVICEDWYHGRHLGEVVPPQNYVYSEMICTTCMEKHSFLWNYTVAHSYCKIDNKEIDEDVDVEEDTIKSTETASSASAAVVCDDQHIQSNAAECKSQRLAEHTQPINSTKVKTENTPEANYVTDAATVTNKHNIDHLSLTKPSIVSPMKEITTESAKTTEDLDKSSVTEKEQNEDVNSGTKTASEYCSKLILQQQQKFSSTHILIQL